MAASRTMPCKACLGRPATETGLCEECQRPILSDYLALQMEIRARFPLAFRIVYEERAKPLRREAARAS